MLTKDVIGKLSVEQREILAQLELTKGRRRQKLLEQARGLDWRSRYFPVYMFGVFLVCVTLYYFNFARCQQTPLACCYLVIGMGLVCTLIFHITRTNRRLDALLELLDLDHAENPEAD